ncbi:hypothetical protein K431DRAFT_11444 [Polychaeton citri CBS 116435]|uniref:Uncharacterized protein n=1 Tax=Polychaeton citri CBS 116435 TaxID=1314669 RepID=A0A9P4PZ08_9PEZI|nr:hypothetical protein K431DRAFT_11444 [Polychaeton citri CBS 116435]
MRGPISLPASHQHLPRPAANRLTGLPAVGVGVPQSPYRCHMDQGRCRKGGKKTPSEAHRSHRCMRTPSSDPLPGNRSLRARGGEGRGQWPGNPLKRSPRFSRRIDALVTSRSVVDWLLARVVEIPKPTQPHGLVEIARQKAPGAVAAVQPAAYAGTQYIVCFPISAVA